MGVFRGNEGDIRRDGGKPEIFGLNILSKHYVLQLEGSTCSSEPDPKIHAIDP